MNERARILVVDDDSQITRVLTTVLASQGYSVRAAADGVTAHTMAAEWKPDLVLTDLGMPRMNGVELCRRFRTEEETRRTPIIMLTARTEEGDKVRGLDLGADDYITKPFGVRELVARVRAALRRSGYEERSPKFYDDGQLRIDYADFSVTCQGRSVKLTRKEFALLSILSRNKGRVAPREQLLDQVWGLEYYGEARTLDVHISGLRKKLGACGGCIETVIGIGYRFRPGAESTETTE